LLQDFSVFFINCHQVLHKPLSRFHSAFGLY
jgi:hypothetical protein